VLNSPSKTSGDQVASEEPKVTVEEKVESEVKDTYHHLVHHRDGDQGFRYHYQETPAKKPSDNPEDAEESVNTEPSKTEAAETEHSDLFGRSSSIGSPRKVGFESSAVETSGASDAQDFPDLFAGAGESGLPTQLPAQHNLRQSVSVSRSETQGPLLKLSSLEEEVKTGKRRSVTSAIADGAGSQQTKGIQTGLSVIVSRTSSSSQQRVAKVNVRPMSGDSAATETDGETTTLRTPGGGRSSEFFNEEEWKRVEDGVFGAKTIISVRKSVQSRA
jgi:hypothetical protein